MKFLPFIKILPQKNSGRSNDCTDIVFPFYRNGENKHFVLRLNSFPREVKQAVPESERELADFLSNLERIAGENRDHLMAIIGHTPSLHARTHKIPSAHSQINQTLHTYRNAVVAAHQYFGNAIGDPGKRTEAIKNDLRKTRDWLLREFRETINKERQIAVGVTHYIWRSSDDDKVRSSHAERDDRVFSWAHQHSDGHPSVGFGCRCHAEPAIVDNHIFLSNKIPSADFEQDVNQAILRGGTAAATDIVAATGSTLSIVTRFLTRGLRGLDGSNSPEDQQEFEDMLFALLSSPLALRDLELRL